MNAKALFNEAVREASGCALLVGPEQFGDPTPCDEWNVRALLNHMVYELSWAPDLLAGKTVAEVGDKFEGDLLGENALAAWRRAVMTAMDAVKKADLRAIVHLSYGDFPAEHYIRELGGDMLIHGWDLDQAIKCTLLFDNATAQATLAFVEPRADEFKQSGLFGRRVSVQDGDRLQTKLLAFFGRREPAWEEVTIE
jgi:uncharacterized protein (TIGR03086 family)